MRTKTIKRITVFALIATMAISYMPSSQASAKVAKKPAKVKALKKSSVSQNSIVIKWKKVKKAKVYHVYQKKNGKFRKVREVKSTHFAVENLKPSTVYRFKVRAVSFKMVKYLDGAYRKGIKKGKFSKTLKVRTLAAGKFEQIDPKKGGVENVREGSTYIIKGTKVKITNVEQRRNGEFDIEGTTEGGGEYWCFTTGTSLESLVEGIRYKDTSGLYKKEQNSSYSARGGKPTDYWYSAYIFTLSDGVNYCWSFDNKEPSLGMKDRYGNINTVDFGEYDNGKKYVLRHKNTQLAGTLNPGKTKVYFPYRTKYRWYKVYENGKLVEEIYQVNA